MSFLIRANPRLRQADAQATLLAAGRGTVVFIDVVVPELWAMAVKYQLEPVGVVAQSGHETGWGTFQRAARPEMHNTCGLKWHDSWRRQLVQLPEQGEHTLSHAAFPNWKAGADAQCQHILAYMGVQLPPWQVITDPRYNLALDIARRKGVDVKKWSDMKDGIWSTGANYGAAIEKILRDTFKLKDDA